MPRVARDVRDVETFSPATVAEAIQVLSEVDEPVKILAGGTDLMVQLGAGALTLEGIVLDIWGLDELRYIREEGGEIRIGALTTYADLMRSELLQSEAATLVAAAATVGAVQTQNRGTLGGNVMNASPAGDTMPPLLAMGASVVLVSNEGPRTVPLYSFYAGYRKTVAKPSELLTEVRIPRGAGPHRDYFRKVGARRAQAIAKVVMAGRARDIRNEGGAPLVGDIRIGIGSVTPTPNRLFETERIIKRQPLDAAVIAQAVQMLGSEITPIDDVRSSAAYRRAVAKNMLQEYLEDLLP